MKNSRFLKRLIHLYKKCMLFRIQGILQHDGDPFHDEDAGMKNHRHLGAEGRDFHIG